MQHSWKSLHGPVYGLAALAGTFNYEFVCDLGKRVPRVFVKDGKIVGTKDYFEDDYEVEI